MPSSIIYPRSPNQRSRRSMSRPDRRRAGSRESRKYMLSHLYDDVPPARVGATTSRHASQIVTPIRSSYPPKQYMPIKAIKASWWTRTSKILTCCICPGCLTMCGKKDPLVQQAWREKMTLCLIIFLMNCLLFLYTIGTGMIACGQLKSSTSNMVQYRTEVVISGYAYEFRKMQGFLSLHGVFLTSEWQGEDITKLFQRNEQCSGLLPLETTCILTKGSSTLSVFSPKNACLNFNILKDITPKGKIIFSWDDLKANIQPPHTLAAFNGIVMNVTDYFNGDTQFLTSIPGGQDMLSNNLGHDMTFVFMKSKETLSAIKCLIGRYQNGFLENQSTQCTLKSILIMFLLLLIWMVTIVRIVMALMYQCIFAEQLVRKPKKRKMSKDATALAVSKSKYRNLIIFLVTCYSEGKAAIQATLDSIAHAEYPDRKKLIFVVADGLITGSGNKKSTPDILVDMIEQDPLLDVSPLSYIAIAEGAKQHNRARVYAGYYNKLDHRIPIVIVVKCGTRSEEKRSKKPGNRGKRDSQLILMNLLSRVVFDDRMTPLDYDICYKIRHVMNGITADRFDFVLMIDADTVIQKDSVKYMMRAMHKDELIMGLCGETRVSNKFSSWVTMIQIFEYFLSHHLNKCFESMFGGVTCLPGCFCLYRVKLHKPNSNSFTPVLVNPDIVEEYSENSVQTLHEKNLLLLGEDRFLTTLMLRQFPKRRLMFVPKAICHTVVPESFSVLLSQRRRWINSTIHNLFELLRLKELCGVFCFSVRFVVFLDLLGTVLLPGSIVLLLYFIVATIITKQLDITALLIVCGTLGIPGIITICMTGHFLYIFWMLFYILSLPIWFFVIPIYAFAKFDDFSWGETRQVAGEKKGNYDPLKSKGSFVIGSVVLKRWIDWEYERRMNILDMSAIEKDADASHTIVSDVNAAAIKKKQSMIIHIAQEEPTSRLTENSNPLNSNHSFQSQRSNGPRGARPMPQ